MSTTLAFITALAAAWCLTACRDASPTPPDGGAPRRVAAVTIAPPARAVSPGDTLTLSAAAADARGAVIAGKAATWTSSDTTVATVSYAGVVLARRLGDVTVTATVDSVVGRLELAVRDRPSRLFVRLGEPLTEPVRRRGVVLTLGYRDVRSRPAAVRVLVDSGSAHQQEQYWPIFSGFAIDSVRIMVFASGPGTHWFTVLEQVANGQPASASVRVRFEFPDVRHDVTVLPDLGADADALTLDAKGDAAGWVGRGPSRRRAAMWSGGVLAELPLPDALDAGVVRFNAAGDVLLRRFLPPDYASGLGYPAWLNALMRTAVVRTADGALRWLGLPVPDRYGVLTCCDVAAGLNERRHALGASTQGFVTNQSALLDLSTGAVTALDSGPSMLTLNDLDQAAGYTKGGYSYQGRYLYTTGFTVQPLPLPPLSAFEMFPLCDTSAQRWSTTTPIDLSNDTDLLAEYCGAPVLFRGTAPSELLYERLGKGRAHLSRDGGRIALLDTIGTVFLTRVGDPTVSRLTLTDTRWRIDRLSAINASGVIAAHGVDAAGRGAALLLVPAP